LTVNRSTNTTHHQEGQKEMSEKHPDHGLCIGCNGIDIARSGNIKRGSFEQKVKANDT